VATAPTLYTKAAGATHRSSGPESAETGRGTTGASTHSGGKPRVKKAPTAAWQIREQTISVARSLVPGSRRWGKRRKKKQERAAASSRAQ